MTREEAEAGAARLNAEHPERAAYRWMARRAAGGWEVARVKLPKGLDVRPLKPTTEARPRPPMADDPRPPVHRDYWS